MKAKTKAKKTIKKVASKLQKASKAHAGQAKALSKLKLSKGSSVNKAGSKGGNPGQWSARKAQLLANRYKKAGGGYT